MTRVRKSEWKINRIQGFLPDYAYQSLTHDGKMIDVTKYIYAYCITTAIKWVDYELQIRRSLQGLFSIVLGRWTCLYLFSLLTYMCKQNNDQKKVQATNHKKKSIQSDKAKDVLRIGLENELEVRWRTSANNYNWIW